MKSKRSRLAIVGVLALALSVTVGLASGGVADAKKKKGAKVFFVARTVPITIPPANNTTIQVGAVKAPIGTVAGKKLKGRIISFSSISVTTSFAGVPGFSADIRPIVIAPNGRNAVLNSPFQNNLVNPTETFSGPTTETTDSSAGVCVPSAPPGPTQPPCSDPDNTLGPPYAGTVGNQNLTNLLGISPLGTWFIKVFNASDNPATLVSISVTGDLVKALPVK
jgi:hypothetical protein